MAVDPIKQLRLRAEDSDDLAAIAALCQDMISSRAEMHFDAPAKRFVLTGKRYCWERDQRKFGWLRPKPQPMRTASALRFEYVENVKFQGDLDSPANLLTIVRTAQASLELIFSAELKIALTCEVIDVTLDDLGPAWPVKNRPQHST
ncbi:MAG: DUF2948 family protein [Pseudomonadota bacterium]